jgi:hypothetical protein
MSRSWRGAKAKQATAALFLLLWLGTWWLSLAPQDWIRPDPFLTHFGLAPFAAAFLVAWWQRTSDGSGLFPLSAPLAGLLVAVAGWGISFTRLLVDVFSRTSQPEMFVTEWAVPMFLSGALVMCVAGLVAGSMGGLAGSLLAAGMLRLRQHGRRAERAA